LKILNITIKGQDDDEMERVKKLIEAFANINGCFFEVEVDEY